MIKLSKKDYQEFLLYMEVRENNIIVSDYYNLYLDNKNEYKNLLNSKFIKTNEDVSTIFLSKILTLDLKDKETSSLTKKYQLDKIKELDNSSFLNDPYYLKINLNKSSDNKKNINFKIDNDLYTLGYKSYEKYELFLYDEVKTNKDDYYIEINNLAYFKDSSFKYLYLAKNNKIRMSIIPHEINTMNKDILKLINDLDSYLNSNNNPISNINIYIYGLGLGYFPFIINNKIKEYLNKNNNNLDINIDIRVIEYDSNIINIFNKYLKKEFIKNNISINIINMDAISFNNELINNNYNNNSNNTYNIIYIDLWHTPIDSLKTYLYFKRIELNIINNNINNRSSNNLNYYYWIESSIIIYLRRIILLIIYDLIHIDDIKFYYDDLNIKYGVDPLFTINNLSSIDDNLYLEYLEYKIYSYLKDMNITSINDIKALISDEGILKIIKEIDLV